MTKLIPNVPAMMKTLGMGTSFSEILPHNMSTITAGLEVMEFCNTLLLFLKALDFLQSSHFWLRIQFYHSYRVWKEMSGVMTSITSSGDGLKHRAESDTARLTSADLTKQQSHSYGADHRSKRGSFHRKSSLSHFCLMGLIFRQVFDLSKGRGHYPAGDHSS